MKFSLFFEMQVSEPSAASERACFHAAVRQAELADELGYHAVWAVEHHGLYEYSHSSAPEVFLSYVAARTRRIRLGHGVTLLPHRFNHPLRVAERIATLDILSEGRVLWGTGKSSSLVEQGAFECDPSSLDAEWEEAVRMIPEMWQRPVFEHTGTFFRIPPTQVVPKPVQVPHPPIFVACSRPEMAVRAGSMGLGALNFSFGTHDQIADTVSAYREAFRLRGASSMHSTHHIACTPPALILADDRKACEYGFRGARFFGDALNAYYRSDTRPLGALDVRRGFLSEGGLERVRSARGTAADTTHALIGDPAFARAYVERFRTLGVDELILVMQMGTVPENVVLESVRTFGEQVLPHFG